MLVQRRDLRFGQGKTELFVTHAQALAGDFGDNARRAQVRGPGFDQRIQRTAAGVLVFRFIHQDFLERVGDFSLEAVFLELAANQVQRAAAALGDRNGGPLQRLVLAADFLCLDRSRAVQQRRVTRRIARANSGEFFVLR